MKITPLSIHIANTSGNNRAWDAEDIFGKAAFIAMVMMIVGVLSWALVQS